ncbi:MAG: phosphoribosylamine--glycine ligase [Actinomycetota bacterium]
MKVLLLGGGGREHALGWKLAQSPLLTELISAPGNPGLASLGRLADIDVLDPTGVTAFATREGVDLVVVGPEAPLAAGVADALIEAGIRVFGPSAAGARLESSKAYAKEIMFRAGVPTGSAETFTDLEAATAHLDAIDGPYVVKADGLAAGKGVLVTDDLDAAKAWAGACLAGVFGEAGATVVVEEYLSGREVSVFALVDGTRAIPLEPARDYKRLRDGDKGPNTGGMGCFSPVSDLPRSLVENTMTTVVSPVLETLRSDGVEYRGFLYVGLVLTDDGPRVLEFNARLGDPETQVILPRLEEDLLTLLAAGAAGDLPTEPLRWSERTAVDVVLASKGYPEKRKKPKEISGLEEAGQLPNTLIFQAGTGHDDDALVTSGGRVLNVVGLGDTLETARETAYEAAAIIDFKGKQLRTDIGT